MTQLDMFASAQSIDIDALLMHEYRQGDLRDLSRKTGLDEKQIRNRAMRLGLSRLFCEPHKVVINASSAPTLYRQGLVSSIFQIGSLQ